MMKKLDLMIGLIILIGSLSPIYYLSIAETEIVIVDCYDNNYNVIDGATCEDEVYTDSKLNIFHEYIPLMIIMNIVGIMLIVMGITTSHNQEGDE